MPGELDMTWTPRPKEIEEVTKLDGPARYDYFVKHVVDESCLVGLWTAAKGWDLLGGAQGECLPVWPHAAFADRFANAPGGSAAQAKPITLDEFLDRWVPGMTKDGKKVAVFPVDSGGAGAVVVTCERLASDLRKYREESFAEDE
jgi:hypothetical protein